MTNGEEKSEEKSLDEKVQGEEKPNLEEIATKLANMEERHKMDQLLPTVTDAFVNYPGVKYKDDKGVEHYKTTFTAKETKNIADTVFDKLAYHAHLRRYGEMTPTFFDELKKMKDADGNLLTEAEVQRAFGITKTELIKKLLKEKDNLTIDHFNGLVRDMLSHHKRYVAGNVMSSLEEKHAGYLADFIKQKVKEHKLPESEYKIPETPVLEDLLGHYQKIAEIVYKKKKENVPETKEEKEYNP